MKLWKHTLISIIAFIGLSSSVLYTSCTDDSCLKLKCRNGGTCANEKCKCPSGYEGTQCESKAADRFTGTYYGITKVNQQPPVIDSVYVTLVSYPATVSFMRRTRPTDFIQGTVNSNGNITILNDPNFGGRNITISVENDKITFIAVENPNGDVQNINFVGTLYAKK